MIPAKELEIYVENPYDPSESEKRRYLLQLTTQKPEQDANIQHPPGYEKIKAIQPQLTRKYVLQILPRKEMYPILLREINARSIGHFVKVFLNVRISDLYLSSNVSSFMLGWCNLLAVFLRIIVGLADIKPTSKLIPMCLNL